MAEFRATIQEGTGGGAFVAVPAEAIEALGGGGRIPVQATFDGVAYRGSVVSMGGAKYIGLLKGIREELGKGPGDTVAVILVRDDAERTIEVPEDLATALAQAGARAAFDRLSYSHRREHVNAILQAKRPETRTRRITHTIESLQK